MKKAARSEVGLELEASFYKQRSWGWPVVRAGGSFCNLELLLLVVEILSCQKVASRESMLRTVSLKKSLESGTISSA